MQWAWDGPEAAGTHCPVLLLHEATPLIDSHRWMERGFLPCEGGWRAQPAWWLTAIEALAAGVAQATQELRRSREAADGSE